MKHRLLALCLVCTAFGVGGACSSAKDRGAHWVTLVQRAHESADDSAQRSPAVIERALRQALSEAPDAPNQRERWVIQDLYYRLGQTLADAGALDGAATEVERGLAIDAAPTLARANLLALQGKLFERNGNTEAASRAYHAALLVNEVLMDQALNGSTEPPRGKP